MATISLGIDTFNANILVGNLASLTVKNRYSWYFVYICLILTSAYKNQEILSAKMMLSVISVFLMRFR